MIILLIGGILLSGVAGEIQASEDIEFPFTGIISANNVNIRAGASTNFEILGQLNKMDKVRVEGRSYRWYKIILPEQAQCFINKDYIYRRGKEGIVSADNVNIRAGRGTNYNVLGQLNSGDLVSILEEYESWFRIKPPENCIGWVHSDFVEYYARGELPQEKKLTPRSIFTEEAKERKKPAQITQPAPIASGVIDDLGVIINRPGRQKLMGDNGKIFYLKSETVNLARYVYYHVRIWGSMEEVPELKYPLITVEKIEVIE